MTQTSAAKKIGRIQAAKAITVGLLIAYAIIAQFEGGNWLWLFGSGTMPSVLFTALLLYGASYFWGGISGKLILIKTYPALFVGLVSGFLITGTVAFWVGILGLFRKVLSELFGQAATLTDPGLLTLWYDGLILVLGVWIVGFFPLVLVGVWYGWSVKRQKFEETIA